MGNSVQEHWTRRRSTTCSNGSCVEIACNNDVIRLRNSKNGRMVLKFTLEEWRAFTRSIKAGEFDDSAQPQEVAGSPLATFLLLLIRDATVDDVSQGRVLKFWKFVRGTWLAFAGVAIVGAVIVGGAVAGGAALAGFHPHVALGLGAGGCATLLITATFRIGRCLRVLVRALSDVGPQSNCPPARARRTELDVPAA